MKVLKGEYSGQYHITLTARQELGTFADNVPQVDPTPLGGWDRIIKLQPFDGPNPVGGSTLKLHFLGLQSERRDYDITAQSSEPYALWAPGRAFPVDTDVSGLTEDVILIIRDVHDSFHARWIQAEDRQHLPSVLRNKISDSRGTGVLTMTAGAPENTILSGDAQKVRDALLTHHNVLIYGPPATGKTRLLTEVRESFRGPAAVVIDTTDERQPLSEGEASACHSAWATFHQSYSYEDFLLGLRPDPSEDGGFRLVPVPGVLLEMSEWARQDGNSSLLVIDEINRGNVSRIFGEFITLMEPDKRLDDAGDVTPTTVDIRLPYLPEGMSVAVRLKGGETVQVPSPFTMPRRVYTLATMNSVDKSVAPLDAALRRRFHVIDLAPSAAALAEALALGGLPADSPSQLEAISDVRALAVLLLVKLNDRLTMFLGPEYQFGQWYFQRLIGVESVESARAVLVDIWRTGVLPQLEEYFVGRSDQLLGVLGLSTISPALSISEPSSALEDLGATKIVRANPDASEAQVLSLLMGIVAGE